MSTNKQAEMSIPLIQGEPMTKLPEDLYIPPDALEIFLETFSGPLDLLLYLIRRQNIDILDIPIAEVTQQYIKYIELMDVMKFELAAEYLVMAAMLAEIKSRMLLPRQKNEEGEEEDPRAELIRRLQEYERYKIAAESLDALDRIGRDTFTVQVDAPFVKLEKPLPDTDLQELLLAFNEVLKRADLNAKHHVQREPLSVRERMSMILSQLEEGKFLPFTAFFDLTEGRSGLVVTFIAILELFKSAIIEVVQSEPFAQIHIKKGGN